MVSRFNPWRVYLLISILGLSATSTAAAPQRLEARLSASTVELGKPLLLTITCQARRPLLSTLDISALQKDFHVIAPLTSDQLIHHQRWQLHLYPYQTGIATIPQLTMGAMRTLPIPVTVTSPIDPKTESAMEFSSNISTKSPWLKQALHINAELVADAPLLVLDVNHPALGNGTLFAQPATHESIDSRHFRHRIGWTWFPQYSGSQTIGPLQITLQRDGVITHTFYIRPDKITVKPLPHYLPATLPVGRFELQQTSPIAHTLLTQQLYPLGMDLRAINMLPADVPDMESLLHSTAAFTLLAGTRQQHQSMNPYSFITTVSYNIPFSPNKSGVTSPGILRLQSFDPDSGRLHTTQLTLHDYLSLAPWLAMVIGFLCIILIGLFILRLTRGLHRRIMRIGAYRTILRQLNDASSTQDLRKITQDISLAENWPANLSLYAWLDYWQKKYGANAKASELIMKLNRALYRNEAVDIDVLARQLRELCYLCLAWFGWLRG